jgi:hypothetical protein
MISSSADVWPDAGCSGTGSFNRPSLSTARVVFVGHVAVFPSLLGTSMELGLAATTCPDAEGPAASTSPTSADAGGSTAGRDWEGRDEG